MFLILLNIIFGYADVINTLEQTTQILRQINGEGGNSGLLQQYLSRIGNENYTYLLIPPEEEVKRWLLWDLTHNNPGLQAPLSSFEGVSTFFKAVNKGFRRMNEFLQSLPPVLDKQKFKAVLWEKVNLGHKIMHFEDHLKTQFPPGKEDQISELDCSECIMDDDGLVNLAQVLSRATNLTEMALTKNSFVGDVGPLVTVFPELKLNKLDLSFSDDMSTDPEKDKAILGALPTTLEELNVGLDEDNNCNGKLTVLINRLPNLTKLKTLRIFQNSFDPQNTSYDPKNTMAILGALPQTIVHLKLRVRKEIEEDKQWPAFIDALKRLENLKELVLPISSPQVIERLKKELKGVEIRTDKF